MYRGQGKFLYLVIRVIVPTVPDVPEPRFSPQALEAIDQDECVEKPPAGQTDIQKNYCQFCMNSKAFWQHEMDQDESVEKPLERKEMVASC